MLSFVESRSGAARRSRTPNLQIRSLSLYPVELWLHETTFVRTTDCRIGEAGLQPPLSTSGVACFFTLEMAGGAPWLSRCSVVSFRLLLNDSGALRENLGLHSSQDRPPE